MPRDCKILSTSYFKQITSEIKNAPLSAACKQLHSCDLENIAQNTASQKRSLLVFILNTVKILPNHEKHGFEIAKIFFASN